MGEDGRSPYQADVVPETPSEGDRRDCPEQPEANPGVLPLSLDPLDGLLGSPPLAHDFVSGALTDAGQSALPAAPSPLAAAEPETYLRHYRTRFASLSTEERAQQARGAQDLDLVALCLDPDPRILQALLDSPQFGLVHARFAARWHRSPRGLDALARRLEWARDSQVQRHLLTNPQLSEAVLRRLLAQRRMAELYRLAVDRDLPERARTQARTALHERFLSSADPEERAELVIRTEGRVLAFLIGCPLDGRTAQILGSRSLSSSLLIRNLAQFGASPPALLLRLLQQPIVRQQAALRSVILRHPNLPSDAKRSG